MLPELCDNPSEDDCDSWIEAIVHTIGPGFHPDSSGADYVDHNDARLFSDAVAQRLDDDLERCFEVMGDGVYDAACDHARWCFADDDQREKGC